MQNMKNIKNANERNVFFKLTKKKKEMFRITKTNDWNVEVCV